MRQTSWPHAQRDLPSSEEALLPATRTHAPGRPLRQDDAVGSREAYYAYYLSREVQQYHQRLFAKQYPEVASNQSLGYAAQALKPPRVVCTGLC
jgi:hypothetical protein